MDLFHFTKSVSFLFHNLRVNYFILNEARYFTETKCYPKYLALQKRNDNFLKKVVVFVLLSVHFIYTKKHGKSSEKRILILNIRRIRLIFSTETKNYWEEFLTFSIFESSNKCRSFYKGERRTCIVRTVRTEI